MPKDRSDMRCPVSFVVGYRDDITIEKTMSKFNQRKSSIKQQIHQSWSVNQQTHNTNILIYVLSLSSILTHFITSANSGDPDQPAHLCHQIRICNVHIVVGSKLINLNVNIADPGQTTLFAYGIKGVYIE
jgi:hypothetical protein